MPEHRQKEAIAIDGMSEHRQEEAIAIDGMPEHRQKDEKTVLARILNLLHSGSTASNPAFGGNQEQEDEGDDDDDDNNNDDDDRHISPPQSPQHISVNWR